MLWNDHKNNRETNCCYTSIKSILLQKITLIITVFLLFATGDSSEINLLTKYFKEQRWFLYNILVCGTVTLVQRWSLACFFTILISAKVTENWLSKVHFVLKIINCSLFIVTWIVICYLHFFWQKIPLKYIFQTIDQSNCIDFFSHKTKEGVQLIKKEKVRKQLPITAIWNDHMT